jgi:hypothetical protein
MANLILGNTTGEVCCEIQQSYMRLTGNYVGPLSTSSNSLSGFLIRDANNNSGIYVANCAIQTCKNKIEYTDVNSSNPAYLVLPANKCLHISGNNSVFSFSNAGNFSAGSGIYSVFNGIQSFSSSPSFTLIPNTSTLSNAFRSLNCSCQVQFYICQTGNSGVFLSGSNAFRFDNLDKQGSYYISGNSTSVSGLPLSNYSFTNYGNSYFGATSLFSGNLNITGTGCFNAFNTGLDINTRSIFRKDSLFSGNITLTGGYAFASDGSASFKTGIFPNLSGEGYLCFKDGFINSILAASITGTGNSCFRCIKVSGLCATTGCFDNINALGSQLLICNYTNLCLSGSNLYNYGSFQNFGDFVSTGSARFYNICTTGLNTSKNIFSGCITASNDICSSGNISGINFLTAGLISGGNLSGLSLSGQIISQLNGSTITCFNSSGFHIGTVCTGYIKAVNTAKAWGRITIIDGIQKELVGYNIKSHTVYATAMPPVAASLIYAHGICFCEPIKYPFSITLDAYPSGNPIITGHNNNTQGGLQLGFSGAAAAALVGLPSPAVATFPNVGAIFYALSGKNAANGNLSPYATNTCYSEIYFNLTNTKGPGTIYSELTAQNSDAIINFTIFGS